MKAILRTLLVGLLAAVTWAQDSPKPAAAPPAAASNPLVTNGRFVHSVTKAILLRAAELMPEENYSFKPVDSVRTYGQIVGHIADSQYTFCSMVRGEKNPRLAIEKTKSSKADLIASLGTAFDYCDTAFAGLTDVSAADMVKLGPNDAPKLGVLGINQAHTMEHYGNLVTYMRMKSLVPPTSDPAFMQQFRK